MTKQQQQDPHENIDSSSFYRKIHVWNSGRIHRNCGISDTLSDEHLYKSSKLGRAEVEPVKLVAGTVAPLKIIYIVGEQGLDPGDQVFFRLHGQNSLGVSIQSRSCDEPGFMEISDYPENSVVVPAGLIGFRIEKGQLRENDEIVLSVSPFRWTALAGNKYLKTVIVDHGGIEKRLPEPLCIEVTPEKAERLEIILPGTSRGVDNINVSLTVRDCYDNCVESANGGAVINIDNSGIDVPLVKGKAETALSLKPGKEVIWADAEFQGLRAKSNKCLKTEENELNVYFGDLHCHDFLSQAAGFTDTVYLWARDQKRLDFVSVSQQCHGWIDNHSWTIVKFMNERFLQEFSFVTLLGFEWQHSGYGDKVIHFLNGDQPYLPSLSDNGISYDSPEKLYEAIRLSDALVISHHPAYPAGSWCSSTDFERFNSDFERLVEIWSMHGSSEGYDRQDRPLIQCDWSRTALAALRKGLRFGFTGGSDTHSGRPGGSASEPLPYWGGLTAVWAENLTRRGIFKALWQRHTYALTGARIVLKMTVNGSLMGEELPYSDFAEIEITVWAPDKIATVEIVKNGELLTTFRPDQEESSIHYRDRVDKEGTFYYSRVTLADGNLAVSSPVWIG